TFSFTLRKLRQMQGRETETKQVNRVNFARAVLQRTYGAVTSIHFFPIAVSIACDTEFQFEVVVFRRIFFEMILHHARVFDIQPRLPLISPDEILNRTGSLLLLLIQ